MKIEFRLSQRDFSNQKRSYKWLNIDHRTFQDSMPKLEYGSKISLCFGCPDQLFWLIVNEDFFTRQENNLFQQETAALLGSCL